MEVESYRFTNVRWPPGPFEGRHMPRFDVDEKTRRRTFPAGSMLCRWPNRSAKWY